MLKYIITLGPASSEIEVISKLLNVADCFRLNSSHLSKETLDFWLQKIETVFQKENKEIPVIIDLQGAKMRIGEFPSVDQIPEKIILNFASCSYNTTVIPVPHREFFNSVKVDDFITLNDMKVKIKIISVDQEREKENVKRSCKATVVRNGPLSSNKGINIETHPVAFNDLTYKDKVIIGTSLKYRFTCFAFSFLNDGDEADRIRPLIKKRKLVAKIERPEAFSYLDNIDTKFDEIWLCRGDLGAQAGIYNLGMLQEKFVNKMSELKHDCVLAGQVLEHMTSSSTPTRSEIVHLYDTEKNGFKGIVLSDETAVGKNPLAVSEFLNELSNH
jgi:pyruvate kinase